MASVPQEEAPEMREGFTIHHNGPQAHVVGRPHERCEQFWAGVRDWHVENNGWSDIAYSFGVCHHDHIFAGRGWDRSQWANGHDEVGVDDGDDSEWYSVLVFVGGGKHGGFDTGEPEEPIQPGHVSALKRLIRQGRSTNRADDRVLPHNAFKHKACPAQTLTDIAARLDRSDLATPPLDLEDDDMIPEIIKALYRAKHGNSYDVSVSDPGAFAWHVGSCLASSDPHGYIRDWVAKPLGVKYPD